MLIFRYLAKEVLLSLFALTIILLLIFMSNQFVQYINRAANGQIPLIIIMKLMALEIPNLASLLLPLGFYMALLLTYGRMYADSEMTVLSACGYGSTQLLKHSMVLAALVSFLVLAIMLILSPYIAKERITLLKASGLKTLIQTILPGRFQEFSQGKMVFYVESLQRKTKKAEHLFLARQITKNNVQQWEVLSAQEGYIALDKKTQQDSLVLSEGKVYQGVPGKANFRLTDFAQYQARIPSPTVDIKEDARILSTRALLTSKNKNAQAELQWRISIPLMVLTLTLVALPLSRVQPRSGKFAKILPAILLYIIYANFMFVGRSWMQQGTTPLWLGLWWLHALVALLGFFLLWKNRRNTV